MRMFKFIGAKVLAVAIAFSVAPLAVPSGVPVVGISKAEAQYYGDGRNWRGDRGYYSGGRDYRGDGGYYRGGRGYYGDRGYRRHHRGNGGAAIAGAVIGLGLGAAIASANQPRYYRDAPRYYEERPVYYRRAPVYSGGYEPWTRAWYNYCSQRYRSFDARSGTFQPYNGHRQMCR